MFLLYANKTNLSLRRREQLTSGSVNAYEVLFEFSPDWEGLERVAVFRAGEESQAVALGADGQCTIPWEVLTSHGRQLTAGVYGTRGGEVVLPTVWANLGVILEGAAYGGETYPPTPELWRQELARKGDNLEYDGEVLRLRSGEKVLSEVPVTGGGAGGASDHRALTHRDAENQHPISSITGLENELERIPEPAEPLTNEELEAILK